MFMYIALLFFLFFFQAEDGIRDVAVTGVQTCALPISSGRTARERPPPSTASRGRSRSRRVPSGSAARRSAASRPTRSRSGEGRVGEEGRSRGSPDYLKKKKREYKEELRR